MKTEQLRKLVKTAARLGEVHIGSQEIQVYSTPLKDAYGFCVPLEDGETAILIDSGLSDLQVKRTLLHEILEAGNDIFDLGLDETKIRVLEQVITQATHGKGFFK